MPFDAAIDLLTQRLPPRALDTVIDEDELSIFLLDQLDITHDTIGRLLQEAGVRERKVVEEQALILGVTKDSENAFDLLDPAWRGSENPLIAHVRTLVKSIVGNQR